MSKGVVYRGKTTAGRWLLQLTDTHVFGDRAGVFDGVRTLETLAAVLAQARRRHTRAEAMVLSGDLAGDETEAAYDNLRAVLASSPVPAYCLPGNHDDPTLMRRRLPGGPVSLERRFELGPWRVLLLDTRVPGRAGGRLSASELERLDAELAAAPQAPALVFLHHHPVPVGSPWMDAMGLDNAEELFEVLARNRQVRALACGHVHQEHAAVHRGIPVYATPSTCVQFRPRTDRHVADTRPPAYRWFHLHDDGGFDTGVEWLARAIALQPVTRSRR